MKEALLMTTHILNDEMYRRYRKMRSELPQDEYDVVLFVNNFNGDLDDEIENIPEDIMFYEQTKQRIFDIESQGYFCLHLPNNSYMWYNMHLITLDFYLNHKREYSHYTHMEYDVIFNGDSKMLFGALKEHASDVDFIASNMTTHNEDSEWMWYKFGNRIRYIGLPEVMSSLNAFMRISDRAMHHLESSYHTHFGAFHECMIVTMLLNAEQFTIGDLFTSERFNVDRISGVFVDYDSFNTDMTKVPDEPDNKLYHPVKC